MKKRPHHDAALEWDLIHAPPTPSKHGYSAGNVRKADEWVEGYKPWVLLRHANYESQYANIYAARLQRMREWLTARIRSLKTDVPLREKLIDAELKQECWVVGTLYKDMPLRPSALDEYVHKEQVKLDNYCSERDTISVEDETGRALLVGEVDVSHLCTGLVVALRGFETEKGDFHVLEIILPDMAPQTPRPSSKVDATKASSSSSSSSSSQFVVLASGFRVASAEPLGLQVFCDWLSGHFGGPQDQEFASHLSRLIVAGNSLGSTLEGAEIQSLKHHHQHMTDAQQQHLVQPLQTLDTALAQVASSMGVDLMPGLEDPANYCLPQQPFNVVMFPLCSRYSTFAATTNPYRTTINGVQFVGTSGQNIDDLRRNTVTDGTRGALDLACATLRWRHMAPTAPDTLPCYPSSGQDPFLFETTPHVYFIGNQAKFQSVVTVGGNDQSVRVILVPSFDVTKTVVLVNLETLEATPVRIEV